MLFQLTSSSTIRILGAGRGALPSGHCQGRDHPTAASRPAAGVGNGGGGGGAGRVLAPRDEDKGLGVARSSPPEASTDGQRGGPGLAWPAAEGRGWRRPRPPLFPRNSPASAGAARRLLLAAAAGLGGFCGGRPAQVAPQVLGLGKPRRRHLTASRKGRRARRDTRQQRLARGAETSRAGAGPGAEPAAAASHRASRTPFIWGSQPPGHPNVTPLPAHTSAVGLRGKRQGTPAPNKSWSLPEPLGEKG